MFFGRAEDAIVHRIGDGIFWRPIRASVFVLKALAGGMKAADAGGMIARSHEELFAWKLSARLRDEIVIAVDTGTAARDFKFRDQIKDSSASAPRNLAEGFYRFKPKEFAYFTRVARGSLGETKNHLSDGLQRSYFSENDYRRLFKLACWAMATTTNLLTYLLSCVAKGETWAPGCTELPD